MKKLMYIITIPILLYSLALIPFIFLENIEYGDRAQIEENLVNRVLLKASATDEKVRHFVTGKNENDLYRELKKLYPKSKCCSITNLRLATYPGYWRGDLSKVPLNWRLNIFIQSYFENQWYVVWIEAPDSFNRAMGAKPDIGLKYYCNMHEYCNTDTPVGVW